MKPTYPKEGTQEYRVLMTLLQADGAWIKKSYWYETFRFTQSGRALHNLEYVFHWPIEHSKFTDEHGFKSHRIVQTLQPSMFLSEQEAKPFAYDR